ncbi:MAG: [protein-PII] uridylyltransferase, partial [Actinobacteria bacterium]|nr:[protein-PII] uridylyltransferase [Actinomycetota bacterium]
MGTRERRARSNVSDRELSRLFLSALNNRSVNGIALAAVGGYGRGELSPGSDLDILLLHSGQFKPDDLLAFVNALLYPIWDGRTSSADIPRSVDHSVRTR